MYRTRGIWLAAILILAGSAPSLATTPSLTAVLLGEADAGEGGIFRPNWRPIPEKPFAFKPQDFRDFGGWGRLRSRDDGALAPRRRPYEKWNPYRNLDAYTYGVYALVHPEMTFILPGIRMEFNNIADNLVLCLDIAGPISFSTFKEDLQIGDYTLTENTTDMPVAFQALFSTHFYLLGEIQGLYLGPIFGVQSFYFRRSGYHAFPIVGGDMGLRLNLGPGSLCVGAMLFGMAQKHVHPDYGFQVYASLGFLI
jgi:hypothetical protein